MASPFPGMDPYLEHPRTGSNVHHRLITAIAIALAPQVRPKYRVVVEETVYQKWEPMPITAPVVMSAYRILVSASKARPRAELYAFGLADPIPVFGVPLAEGDPSARVDLRLLLDGIYEQSGYDLVIDYRQSPQPPLSEVEGVWAEAWLREKGVI